MNRALALIGAVLLSFLSIASACVAETPDRIQFSLDGQGGSEGIQATFQSDRPNHVDNWDSRFRPGELVGLDLAGFRAGGTHPVRFSVIREAGRLDCSGSGGRGLANGSCGFTPDPGFTRLLQSRGIAMPSVEQGLALMAVNVPR